MAEPTKPVDPSSLIEEWQLDEIRKGLQPRHGMSRVASG